MQHTRILYYAYDSIGSNIRMHSSTPIVVVPCLLYKYTYKLLVMVVIIC